MTIALGLLCFAAGWIVGRVRRARRSRGLLGPETLAATIRDHIERHRQPDDPGVA